MYIVIEIQTNLDGTVGTIFYQYENLESAYSKYYSILSVAAVGELPVHTAAIMTNTGRLVESKYFAHDVNGE